jgi:hypothetical protein
MYQVYDYMAYTSLIWPSGAIFASLLVVELAFWEASTGALSISAQGIQFPKKTVNRNIVAYEIGYSEGSMRVNEFKILTE